MLAATTLPGNAGKAGTALVLPPCLQQDAPAPGNSREAGLAAPAVFSKTEPSGSCSRSLGLVGTKRGLVSVCELPQRRGLWTAITLGRSVRVTGWVPGHAPCGYSQAPQAGAHKSRQERPHEIMDTLLLLQ